MVKLFNKTLSLVVVLCFLAVQMPVASQAGPIQNAKEWATQKFSSTTPNMELSYREFYSKSSTYISWVAGACAAVACALIVISTGGTALPIVGSIGTWIGSAAGLTGVAATNYGLALLGGGSLAAGGFGVAGGTILSAVLAGTSDIVFSFAGDTLFEMYEKNKFFENAKKLPTLPLPGKDDGPKSLQKVVQYIDSYYVHDKPSYDDENVGVINNAIAQLKHNIQYNDKDERNIEQLLTMVSLLQFNIGQYDEASATAKNVIEIFKRRESDKNRDFVGVYPSTLNVEQYPFLKTKTKCSIPLSIWGISSLSNPDVNISETTSAMRQAILLEPNNKMNPLIISLYLDRLLLRQDKIKKNYFDHLISAINGIKDKGISTPCYQIILFRSLIMAKRYQDFLRIVKRTPLNNFKDEMAVIDNCKFALEEYRGYNDISQMCLDQINKDNDFMKKESNRKGYNEMTNSCAKYVANYEQLNDDLQDIIKGGPTSS
ncbi:MAG: hypothetical protein ABSA09_03930 [Desulfobaccales bacterium]|jgi:hypothetical protein